jgi:hypothetical protein
MSMEAVALVRIQASELASKLKAAGDSGTRLEGANGQAVDVHALEDATLVETSASIRDSDPDALGAIVRALLGDALDAHDDERGVFTFPKAAMPKATTYDAVIEEVGEMGEWAPAAAASAGDDFASMAAGLLGGLGPEVMDLQRRMMAGDPTAMQDAMKHMGAILADPSKQAALMQAMAALGGGNSPLADMAKNMPAGMAGMPNPADLMENMDLGALQAQAQKMMADNPNLEKDLLEKLAKPEKPGDDES